MEDVNMSFSGILGGKENWHISVSFSHGEKYAEGRLPECRITDNRGFSEEEKAGLEAYMKSNRKTIFNRAKEINPLRAFMGLDNEKKKTAGKTIIRDDS